MTKKNILLMGRTGSGKSTLANVLTETNKFKEGQNALSETSKIQVEVFESEGDEYRIIDTAGIGDNRTSIEVFIWQLAMLTKEIKGGVYQMFLVTRGEIEEEVKYAYELVKEILFDNNLAYRTTIIRTRFDNFESSLEKKKDCELFLKANEKNGNFKRDAKIIFDNNSIIHVDNTSISVKVRRKKEEAARDRNISRDIIFEYLKNISCREIYLPKKISLFSKEIEKYLPVDNREYLGNEVDKLIVEKTIKFIESFNAELSKELRNLISQEVNMNKPFI
jgi:GTPase SAR1 family protein